MKGTLFSADFVKDNSGNLRLLELNTDTTISTNNLDFLDYTELISVLSANNITKVTVVHKPDVHKYLVSNLSSSLNANAPFITTFTEVKEAGGTIYPTVVDDADDLFVLRMAYDESAIFDSEYAKGTLNTLKLFADYNSGSLVSEFYHSSSVGSYDTITKEFNQTNVPDCVVKDLSDIEHSYLRFYKIGSESESDTNNSRWESFLSSSATTSNIVQRYHINSDAITDNKVSSIRTYSIIYGSNLELAHIGQFEQDSPFFMPDSLVYNSNSYVNEIDTKHYYEFATNIPKLSSTLDGILSTHEVLKADGSYDTLGNIQVGDELASYYIAGVDLSNDDATYQDWTLSGSQMPSGSYLTSSAVIYKNSRDVFDKTLTKLTVAGGVDTLYVATNKSFLVYDSGSDTTSWTLAMHIDPSTNYLLDYDGSLADISQNNLIIINEDTFSLVEIDVEDTDTFIISGSTDINSYVVHNAPCFVAGTQIKLPDGTSTAIENITVGDQVQTYKFKDSSIESNIVKNVFSKRVGRIVKYSFDNGTQLHATVDHPIYVEGKGWSSYDNIVSNELYTLEQSVKTITIGDVVKTYDGSITLSNIEIVDEQTVVYNLQDIQNNHNFYANEVLVHNRKY